jgi:methylenetetrahydrofolate--tRNA-(uracil-5-)-methyltransferase
MPESKDIIVIGGGLAGCEAAHQLAQRGHRVKLYEMRYSGRPEKPGICTPAHQTGLLAELVCSNSLKSEETSNAHGLLKAELKMLDSLILRCAEDCRVPAGKALAVDRERFAKAVTEAVSKNENIEVIPEESPEIPAGPTIVASGPLTSDRLAAKISELTGTGSLFFYDAIAPIVSADSLDRGKMFKASRYSDEEGEYWNAPLTKQQYQDFVGELARAQKHEMHGFEAGHFYEGCLPVEELARRDTNALRFGMMKPVGLYNPHEGRRPYAVLQLRQENSAGTMFNLVGFQTQLRTGEQRRVFGMIPGLEKAEFLRYGSMHRNTFLHGPSLLNPGMQSRSRNGLFFAGQLTGMEGYVESVASGLVAGINLHLHLKGREGAVPPETTMTGALCRYVSQGGKGKDFQPMNANFGLLPKLENDIQGKKDRYRAYASRALNDMKRFCDLLSDAE